MICTVMEKRGTGSHPGFSSRGCSVSSYCQVRIFVNSIFHRLNMDLQFFWTPVYSCTQWLSKCLTSTVFQFEHRAQQEQNIRLHSRRDQWTTQQQFAATHRLNAASFGLSSTYKARRAGPKTWLYAAGKSFSMAEWPGATARSYGGTGTTERTVPCYFAEAKPVANSSPASEQFLRKKSSLFAGTKWRSVYNSCDWIHQQRGHGLCWRNQYRILYFG